MKNRVLTSACAAMLVLLCSMYLVACGKPTSGPVETGSPAETSIVTTADLESHETTTAVEGTSAESETVTETETTAETATETESETESETEEFETEWEINMADLNVLMQPIFSGTTVKNETVMFIDKGDVKSLLYPIESVQSVTSYDGQIVYEEGKDYIIENGQIKVTENSAIPCITSANFYNVPDSILIAKDPNGNPVKTYWGEGDSMAKWQVNVNYTHAGAWDGFTQRNYADTYQDFIKKLQDGEDVTVFFYGDSITGGANASWCCGYAPYQHSYSMLFTEALADLYDYTVHYVSPGLGDHPVPSADYVAGTRGTITYVNTAVGGWTSENGVGYLQNYVVDKVNAYGCDLLVVAYGMNDIQTPPTTTRENVKTIADAVLALKPDASLLLISTMVPNPDATNGWYVNQPLQERSLLVLANTYRDRGTACAVARMTSISLDVLKHKEFKDYSGNNVNHPNDFFSRVYAQTLLQTVIGYENMT